MTLLGPGAIVDRYRLVEPAGEGGQGSVWRAEDPLRPGAAIALKLVPVSGASSASIERFRREAHVLARLAHPSLPRCHALFEDLRHDVIGISLDFVEGSPLSVMVASESLTPEHRVWIVRHLAAALAYIHDAGLVHRDVKQDNVMITRGFLAHPEDPAGIKLVDFGIAAESHNPKPLTVTGSVIGTIEYLPPEILDRTFWKDEPQDGPERDVWSLGVLAFEICRGQHPTGLPSATATVGDYMLAYRGAHPAAGPGADRDDDAMPSWPPGIAGDSLEAFYRGTLAIRASARASNGGAAVALLDERASRPSSTHPSMPSRDDALAIPALRDTSAETRAANVGTLRRRSTKVIAGFVAGACALFGLSFYLAYSRPFASLPEPRLPTNLVPTERPNLDAEEPPDPPTPAKPSRPPPPKPSAAPAKGAPPQTVPASVTFPASLACPKEMIAIAGPPPFCIDAHEVSVAEYRRCTTCGAAKDAYWIGPTFTDAAKTEQTANCTNTRMGLDNYPINCVSFQDATAYCASVGKRVPRMSEWRAGRSSIALCTEVGGVCPMFEWTIDTTTLAGYRATRGPSFRHTTALEGSNVEVARNDDLGFRCAKDPSAK